MAKKNKQTVVNNIDCVNLEIDYKKLAEAIVEAQRQFETECEKKKRFSTFLELSLCGMFYDAIIVFSVLLLVDAWWTAQNVITFVPKAQTVFGKLIMTISLLLTIAVSAMAHLEMYADNSKDARDRFNSIVTFEALLVALIAICKGSIF